MLLHCLIRMFLKVSSKITGRDAKMAAYYFCLNFIRLINIGLDVL